jgi:orotate phosphoribosyltransferase
MLTYYVKQLKQTTQIDRLAFIDISSRGPSGLVPCQVAISLATKVPGVTIRPEKRLFSSQVVGDLNANDCVLFLCDVLTTGQTLAHACAVVAKYQAKPVYALQAEPVHALFVYEGDSGRANLEDVGIGATSFMRKNDFLEYAGDLSEAHEKALQEPEPWNRTDLLPALAGQI